MTDADQNVSQEKSYEQVIEDAHVTLTSLRKTKSSKQSSSVSSNFSSKFLILDNVPPVVDEVASMINIKNHQEESSTQAPSLFTSTFNESLENVILDKYSSQPKSTYEATSSLIEFELKKILLDKIEKSKSYQAALKHRELYDGLVKSYNLDKDLFSLYGYVYSLKRDQESVLEVADIEMEQDQGSKFGYTVDKPDGEAAPKNDWFKKPNKPPTPDRAWNTTKSIDFRPPQTWISNIAKAREPPCIFNELMSTLIDFSAYVMNHLKIDNMTQEILVGPAFNLLKGLCKSFVKLEFHLKECYKAVTDRLDWNNPVGHDGSGKNWTSSGNHITASGNFSSRGPVVGIDPLPVGTLATPLSKIVAASMEVSTVAISFVSSLTLSAAASPSSKFLPANFPLTR
uniref:Uncharacterized protein n=1 Tax=Tanacetum cinerariifolium TaxID=118510 RepID=A0A6L2P126_TANCI|nr:hypothetical protein [Tanacetum cinerariifolium]